MSTYTDASLILYPSGYKEDKLYSLKPTDGSGDLTFTRASTATRVNADGLIETSPVNLVEYSEEFDNASWGKAGTVITANTTLAPNGTLTADTCSTSQTNTLNQVMSASTFITYTFSVYVKLGTATNLCLSVNNRVAWNSIGGQSFDSSNGLNTTTWTRISYTFTPSSLPLSSIDCYIGGNYETGLTQSTGTVFIWGAQLNIGSTAKTYFPTTDRLNVPRIDYTGGGCGSLLLEKQSTNLNNYSNGFINGWTASGGTITATANYGISPDGTQNSTRLVFASGSLIWRKGISGLTGNVGTWSLYIKGTAGQTINITYGGVDLLVTLASGWNRYSVTATGTIEEVFINTFGGSTARDIEVWGGQCEISSYPTSYIPCPSSSSVTRLADEASKTGVTSLIGQSEGVLFVDINYLPHEAQSIFAIENWAINSTVIHITSNTSTTIGAQIYFSSGNVFVATFNSAVIGQRYKCALAYKANDFAFYVNGTQISTSSSGAVPATSNVRIGAFISGQVMDGQINQAALFKTRLTNDQLADLTGGNKTTFNALATFYGYTIL